MNFEFNPLRQARRRRQAGQSNRLFGVLGAAGIGQHQVFLGVDEIQDVGERVFFTRQIGAAQGDGDNLSPAGGQRVAHPLRRAEFAGSHQQTRAETSARDG